MATHHDDDVMPEETQGYKLSQPKQSLAEYQQMAACQAAIKPQLLLYSDKMVLTFHQMALLDRPYLRSRSNSELLPPPPPPPTPDISPLPPYLLVEGSLLTHRELCPNCFTPLTMSSNHLCPASQEPVCGFTLLGIRVPTRLLRMSSGLPDHVDEGPVAPDTSDASAAQPAAAAATGISSVSPNSPALPIDANDESLQRYKESLGLGGGKDLSDSSDPRVCIIKSLTLEAPGRDPVTIDLSTPGSEHTLKDKPFKIKEGAKFTMVATFKVQHEILSGLHYVQIVKRKGIRVSKDSEMIGSYAPNTDKQPLYTKKFQEEEAPSGMLARGHYNAVSSFVDDDKKSHLSFEWSFDIGKEW